MDLELDYNIAYDGTLCTTDLTELFALNLAIPGKKWYFFDFLQIRDESINALVTVSKRLEAAGVKVSHVGTGSTPSCSHDTPLMQHLTEIHPGNYVFYDVQQLDLGSCGESDIAGKVLTRVIGQSRRTNEILVDCGFTGLTKQGFEAQGGSFAKIEVRNYLARNMC